MKKQKEYENSVTFVEYIDSIIQRARNINDLNEVTRLFSELPKCFNLHQKINYNMYNNINVYIYI